MLQAVEMDARGLCKLESDGVNDDLKTTDFLEQI